MLQVIKENEHFAYVATLDDARQAIEDDAVIVWQNLRDPNAPDAQAYPGLEWSVNKQHDAFAWLNFGRAVIEYSIVDPMPFVTVGRITEDGERVWFVVYDNMGCDYAHSQEMMIWER